jgi:hypothetical protein
MKAASMVLIVFSLATHVMGGSADFKLAAMVDMSGKGGVSAKPIDMRAYAKAQQKEIRNAATTQQKEVRNTVRNQLKEAAKLQKTIFHDEVAELAPEAAEVGRKIRTEFKENRGGRPRD